MPEESQHSEADLSNLRVGEFLLLRRLGSGGMADVYLAEQTSLGRQVAVKVLKSDAISGTSDVLLRRFEQEARTAGGLNHPNLVQIITTGREGAVSYIVQEYVPGLNLSQWIRRHGVPDYETGLRWMQQIAAALRAASESGIVHRDIKPENVMLTRNGVAKVTDFGLAQLSQPSSPKMNLTQVGTTMGTPWYMSPEQIQGDKLDYRSDQYSMGITCYHMFAGQPPFSGKNPVTVAVQHLREEPAPLNRIRADLPEKLCSVIHRMIQKKPSDRYQTPLELESALEQLKFVPARSHLDSSVGLRLKLRAMLLPLGKAALAGFAVLAVSFAAGLNLQQPIRLPVASVSAPASAEPTATRQFASAMLQPDLSAGWEAVISNFPDTPEADLAELRLGVNLMSGIVPDFNGAYQVFTRVRERSELIPEKSYLRFLGMIGQAYSLKESGRSERFESLITEIKSELLNYDGSLELDLDRAPMELRNFCMKIQAETEQSLAPGFQDFRP